MGRCVKAEQRNESPSDRFPGNRPESQVHLSCLRSHTTSLQATGHAWPKALLSQAAAWHAAFLRQEVTGLCQGTRGGLGSRPCPVQEPNCLTTACPWHLEMATGTQTSTCPPQTPCLCPNSLAVPGCIPLHVANSIQLLPRGGLQRRERLRINKRMPVPLKEFSFIGSSPLPPFQ